MAATEQMGGEKASVSGPVPPSMGQCPFVLLCCPGRVRALEGAGERSARFLFC